jgi:acetoin utilization protein AcuC
MLDLASNRGRYALVYSRRFTELEFGEDHPFKVLRYRLAFDLMERLGLLAAPGVVVAECPLADEADLLLFHRSDYLDRLREFSLAGEPRADFRYGLGDVENPVFPGLYEWSRLSCGGTLEAVRQVVDRGRRLAFNMAGGCHHARPARASGFSYLNDAAVAMTKLVQRGLRVAYIDLDAHHGDAVQQAFYDSNRVLTISLHETGKDFYPHTGFVTEMGEGDGYGYAVNIPFLRHADDLIFEQAFSRVVLPLLTAFKPDLLFTQMGVDGLRTDPLTRLEFTTRSVEFATRAFLATGLPWVAVGGGGYDCFNVARSWTLFWGVATGSPLPDELPPEFDRKGPDPDSSPGRLRDLPHLAHPDDFSRAQAELERVLGFLERRLLPLHEIRRAWGR